MMTLGYAKRCADRFSKSRSPGLIVRLDASICIRQTVPFFQIEDAVKIGASAVMTTYLIGLDPEDLETRNIEYAMGHIRECEEWGMPMITEALVIGRRAIKGQSFDQCKFEVESLRVACRIVSEMGADFIKAPYAGSFEKMKEVVDACLSPILVLGGGKVDQPEELFKVVRNCMDAGCIGCFVGRNVWQYKHPPDILVGLKKIVHEDSSVEEVMRLMSKSNY